MGHRAALIAILLADILDGIGPVHASTPGDGAVTDERILSDPMYLPLAHQFSGATSYSYASGSLNTYLLSGTEINHQTLKTSTVVQTLAWGVTDDFTFRLSDAYVAALATVSSFAFSALRWLRPYTWGVWLWGSIGFVACNVFCLPSSTGRSRTFQLQELSPRIGMP